MLPGLELQRIWHDWFWSVSDEQCSLPLLKLGSISFQKSGFGLYYSFLIVLLVEYG